MVLRWGERQLNLRGGGVTSSSNPSSWSSVMLGSSTGSLDPTLWGGKGRHPAGPALTHPPCMEEWMESRGTHGGVPCWGEPQRQQYWYGRSVRFCETLRRPPHGWPPVQMGVSLRTGEPVLGVHWRISGGLRGQPMARRTHKGPRGSPANHSNSNIWKSEKVK